MKKLICMLAMIVLCISLVCPVFADEFVPSISEKSAPELVKSQITQNGQPLDDMDEACLVVTPVSQAEESEHIPDESEKLLLKVYAGLTDGSMTLPYDQIDGIDPNTMVIRDLFDVSWRCADHPEIVAPAGVHVELTFDLGVAKDAKVVAMTYKHDQWNPVVSIKNNGDGTVTCVFEDFCPVVFAVSAGTDEAPSQTGDESHLELWIALLAVAAVALVVLAVFGRKFIHKAK